MTIKSPDYKNVVKSIDMLLKKPPLWAADLIKQHVVYSHLVPMYRTIHREKPRKLVLRAIRWVNPENFFPMMKKSKQDIENMSKEDLEEAMKRQYRIHYIGQKQEANSELGLATFGGSCYKCHKC